MTKTILCIREPPIAFNLLYYYDVIQKNFNQIKDEIIYIFYKYTKSKPFNPNFYVKLKYS